MLSCAASARALQQATWEREFGAQRVIDPLGEAAAGRGGGALLRFIRMKSIYHYTSVETLALILKNRTIRFTRLDRVDDVEEAQTHLGIPFGRYAFVSCWTREPRESIPQWNMYAKASTGVRIEFPVYPFRRLPFEVPAGNHGIAVHGPMLAPLTFAESISDGYFVMPTSERDHFGGDVVYVEDVAAEYRARMAGTTDGAGQPSVTTALLPVLARLKSAAWDFQKEYRFVLNVFPGHPLDAGYKALRHGDPGVAHIDVAAELSAFDELRVVAGPLCGPDEFSRLRDLLACTFLAARLEKSVLTGSIRERIG